MIIEDNARTKVTPSTDPESRKRILVTASQSPRGDAPRVSMPNSPVANGVLTDELFLTAPTQQQPPSNGVPTRRTSLSRGISPLRRERPTVRPKPASLRLHPVQPHPPSRTVHDGQDALAERFAKIRIQQSTETHRQHGNRRSSSEQSSVLEHARRSSDSTAQIEVEIDAEQPPVSPLKPAGPRPLPRSAAAIPSVPPKIPLSPPVDEPIVQILPRLPKPAYDPSKVSAPPLHSKTAKISGKSNHMGGDDQAQHSPRRESIHQMLPNGSVPPTRSSSMQPPQRIITATDLFSLFQSANILIIDVRSREEFDSGHILAKNVVCVEPVGIRPGMSADELEDRLINSPSSEQDLFERRHKFDYVIYYDQCTQTAGFLTGPPNRTRANHLRSVFDSLYEFNDYKPLRKSPLVLTGGLDAWVDLVGPQALATSKTAALINAQQVRRPQDNPRRPIGRVASASANSSLEVRKRRLREQNPLDADEERSWLEKAQKEEVDPVNLQRDPNGSDANSDEDNHSQPLVHSYEDFLRRFPDTAAIQQPLPPPAPVQHPPPPSHPPPPPPVTVPNAPSMPPPAVQRPSYGGVSDRESSQNKSLSRQTSAVQQPLYTSRSFAQYRKLPRTGLVNFGVTCYMNATIQCLLATIPLSILFLGDSWRQSTVKNWKGSNGILPEYFANLIRNLWKDDCRPVRPTSLRSFCARLKDDWGIDRQQDAKEFFDFIVDCLHEDMNRNFNRNALRPLTDREERVRETWPIARAANVEWDRYLHREQSFISDLFAGQHASRLRCTTCNSTSTTYEPFYSVSIEIPRINPKKGMWDLHRCLQSYCQEEKLAGEEVWKCPHCKREREATKKIIITRAPQFLVIHFKRFEMRKGDAKKVHTPINFPLHGLDLGGYMVQDGSTQAQAQDSMDQATSPPFIYDCYAVMRHIGNTGNGGHYISFVKDVVRSCWRKFDDDRVSDIDPAKLKGDKALQNEQAYLLFYGRASPR